MRLEGRIALVTGASRGIGAATALKLAAEGAATVLNDIWLEGAEALAAQIVAGGGRAVALRADVSNAEEVQAMVAGIVTRFGRVDVLINNAGIVRYQPTTEMTEGDWTEMLDVNLKGAFLCIRAVAPIMMQQRFGKIVNMSSVAAYGAITPGQAHYSASKAGLLGLTRTLALEFGPYGININAVAPGRIVTEMTRQAAESLGENLPDYVARQAPSVPLRRMGRPEDVANVVCFLVSEEASFVHGEIIHVAGGPVVRA